MALARACSRTRALSLSLHVYSSYSVIQYYVSRVWGICVAFGVNK